MALTSALRVTCAVVRATTKSRVLMETLGKVQVTAREFPFSSRTISSVGLGGGANVIRRMC